MTDDEPQATVSRWRSFLARFLSPAVRVKRDILRLLKQAQQDGLIKADALGMLQGVLAVSEMQVRDVMVPRPRMVIIERDAPVEEVLAQVTSSAHSRFPVVGDNRDDIVGVLLAKDLLHQLTLLVRQGKDWRRLNIRECLRPATIVPESKRLDTLLKEFRLRRNHMAIVVDEYGSVSGLVTIEDVLEQIVGEIEDETDVGESEEFIQKLQPNVFHVNGLTDIEEFNEYFKASLSDDEVDTVGGLVIQAFGHMPSPGEQVELNGFRFTVMKADQRRVHQLKVEPLTTSPSDEVLDD